MKANNKNLQPLKDFILEYLKNIDFDYWQKRIDHCAGKLHILKTDRAKKIYTVDLYSTYLQLLEIFFINAMAMSFGEKLFFNSLFVDNFNLRKRIDEQFSTDKFLNWYLDNLVFGIKEKSNIEDLVSKKRQYINIIKECKHDYLGDYDFLNSYKHGYRVQSSGGASLILGGFQIYKGDSGITYFSHDLKNNKLFRNILIFNYERVITKSCFVLNMIKNTSLVYIASREGKKKEINIEHLTITDKEKWGKNFGTSRIRETIKLVKNE